jgi:hypothetical protein
MMDAGSIFDVPDEQHECAARSHHGGLDARSDSDAPAEHLYGAAITRVERIGGRWWAHNEEYSTEVSYCPWCGAQLRASHSGDSGAGA